MPKKPTKIIGLRFIDFMDLVKSGEEINLRAARLIPFYKPGDEMALSSIFLSGLRLITEFRKNLFKSITLPFSGSVHIYTEVEFLLFDKKRIDGLILIVRGKKIIDGVIIEVKNKNNELNHQQISNYIEIAKEYKIPKVLTISNQFVNFPTQSPLSIKTPKYVSLYHFSWSYILTIAHILLIDNDTNISNDDQVEIMEEIVNYLESPKSGVVGFQQMKAGWTEVAHKINAGASLKLKDDSVDETVSSWIEEERDMALILSRELGLLVRSGQKKYKNDLLARINHEKKQLVSNQNLESNLQVDGAVSDIVVKPNFGRKNIEMSVDVKAPLDRKTRPQITWIKNQIKLCQKKSPELYNIMEKGMMLDISIKFSSNPVRVPITEIEDAHEKLIGKEIKSFSIVFINYLGKKFESRKQFVNIIEKMLVDYYRGIIQYLKNWEKPAPKFHKVDEPRID